MKLLHGIKILMKCKKFMNSIKDLWDTKIHLNENTAYIPKMTIGEPQPMKRSYPSPKRTSLSQKEQIKRIKKRLLEGK